MSSVIPQQATQPTIWEELEKDFSKAERRKDKIAMDRIWLKATLTAAHNFEGIPPDKRPWNYMKAFAHPWGDGTRTMVRGHAISTYLGMMAEWSRRKRNEEPGFRG